MSEVCSTYLLRDNLLEQYATVLPQRAVRVAKVGMVTREEPVAEIIQDLADEAAAALESRS